MYNSHSTKCSSDIVISNAITLFLVHSLVHFVCHRLRVHNGFTFSIFLYEFLSFHYLFELLTQISYIFIASYYSIAIATQHFYPIYLVELA